MDFSESHYVEQYCTGQVEYVLHDRTRVDCLTGEHAIEIDWCSKWAEAIGQALYYSKVTGKKPKIVLICKPEEQRFYYRVKTAVPEVEVDTILID